MHIQIISYLTHLLNVEHVPFREALRIVATHYRKPTHTIERIFHREKL